MSTRNYLRAPNYSSFSAYLYIFKVRPHGSRTYIYSHTHKPPRHPCTITTTNLQNNDLSPYTTRAAGQSHHHHIHHLRAGSPSYTLHPIILLPLVPTKDGQQYYIYTRIHPTPRHNTTQSTQITPILTQKYPKPAYFRYSKCHIPDPNRSKNTGA